MLCGERSAPWCAAAVARGAASPPTGTAFGRRASDAGDQARPDHIRLRPLRSPAPSMPDGWPPGPGPSMTLDADPGPRSGSRVRLRRIRVRRRRALATSMTKAPTTPRKRPEPGSAGPAASWPSARSPRASTGFVRTVAITARHRRGFGGQCVQRRQHHAQHRLRLAAGRGCSPAWSCPVLVRASKEDEDGGRRFANSLLTLVALGLVAITVIGMLIAPLIARLYLGSGSRTRPGHDLHTLVPAADRLLRPRRHRRGHPQHPGPVRRARPLPRCSTISW